MIPVGATLLYRLYEPAEYAHITSLTFIPSLIAPALAPFFGGVLLTWVGWRFVFLFSGPISLLLALIAFIILREEPRQPAHKLDSLGFLLSSCLLISVFYVLTLIGREGLSISVLLGLLIFFGLLITFIRWEKHHPHPLIDLNFFKDKFFVKTNLIQICFQACHYGSMFLIGMYLQVGLGMSAIWAGLIMGMQAFGAISTNRYSVKLFNQYGAKLPIISGLAGVALLSPVILLINNAHMILFGLILFYIRGLCSGLCGVPLQTLSVIKMSRDQIGPANSIFNASRQIAISLGVALSSIFIALGLKLNGLTGASSMASSQAFAVFGWAFLIVPTIAIIGILITCSLPSDSTVGYS